MTRGSKMNRRTQVFETLLLLVVAGVLAWAPDTAAASPQASGAGTADKSDQAALPSLDSEASSGNASSSDAVTNSSGGPDGAQPQVASASNRVVPPLYAAHRFVELPRPKL